MAEMPLINIEFNGPTKIEIYQMLGPHPMLPIVMDIAPWDMMDEPDMLVGGTPLHPRYPASGYHSDPYHEGGDWTSPSPSSTEMPRRRGQGNRQGQGTRRKGRTTPGPSGRPTSSPGPSDRPSSSPYPNDRSDPSYGIHDDTMPYGDYDMDGSTTEPTDEMPRRKGQGNRQGNRQGQGTRRKGRTTPGPIDRPSSSSYPNDRSDPSYGIYNDTMPYGDYDMDGTTAPPTYHQFSTTMLYGDNDMPYYNEWDINNTDAVYNIYTTPMPYNEWDMPNGDASMYNKAMPYNEWNTNGQFDYAMPHDQDYMPYDDERTTHQPTDEWLNGMMSDEAWDYSSPYHNWEEGHIVGGYDHLNQAPVDMPFLLMDMEHRRLQVAEMAGKKERFVVDDETFSRHQYGIWHDMNDNECMKEPCHHYHPFGIWVDEDGQNCDPSIPFGTKYETPVLCTRFISVMQLQAFENMKDMEAIEAGVKPKQFMGRRLTFTKLYSGPVLVNPYGHGGYPGFGSFHNTYRHPGYGYGGYGGGFGYGGSSMGFGPRMVW